LLGDVVDQIRDADKAISRPNRAGQEGQGIHTFPIWKVVDPTIETWLGDKFFAF
jgi:hypothetical protein